MWLGNLLKYCLDHLNRTISKPDPPIHAGLGLEVFKEPFFCGCFKTSPYFKGIFQKIGGEGGDLAAAFLWPTLSGTH